MGKPPNPAPHVHQWTAISYDDQTGQTVYSYPCGQRKRE
jgi:hypothetical protein